MAFVELEKLHRLHEGCRQRLPGRGLLFLQEACKVYLIDNRCPHRQSSLHQATVAENCAAPATVSSST